MKQRPILISGEWREMSESFEVRAPYGGEVLATVGSAGPGETEEAIAAADAAAKEMRRMPRFETAKGLRRIADGIERRKEEFVRAIATEAAKPMIYARGEVERGIATFSYASGEAERFAGEMIPVDTQPPGRGKTARTMRVPRGVIYGITPFNFPLNLVAHKVAPALASGNAIVIKPSPRTPLTSLLLGEVFMESGLPAAALQVVPMDVKYMDTVLSDERVSMLSFTGSAAVGWDLKQKAGKRPTCLELGGNAPVIVDETADMELSIGRCVTGAFAYSGQVCISVQRVYVHDSLWDDWTAGFVGGAKSLKVGDPLDEATQLSVMIDEAAAERAEGWANEALANGAEALYRGEREGAMLRPIVLTNTDPEMKAVSEEVFAPIAVVERFSDFRDAVDMANHGKYGLQAGVFTRSTENARFATENLEYGGIIINDAPIFRVDNMPYGGSKESGFGREGVRYAMDEMTEIRLVVESFGV